jgi:hypothetical protein
MSFLTSINLCGESLRHFHSTDGIADLPGRIMLPGFLLVKSGTSQIRQLTS